MPEIPRFPLGSAIDGVITWLTDNAAFIFDAISVVLLFVANIVYRILALPHPLLLIVILAVLAFAATRKVGLPIFTIVAFLLVYSIDLWTETLQTLSVVIMATFFALLIGVPVGVWAARSPSVSVIVRPVLDFMQTLPVFVYLLPAVFFFGIGVVPGIVATIVFALPPAVRLTELGIRQVDREVVEAAHAFGSKPGQVLREVQIPLAMPSIMAGVNQVIMLALSMVVVAGMVGTEGLGQVVVGATQNLDIAGGFESGISVVLLAIYLDRLTGGVSRLSQRRGKGKRKAGAAPEEPAEPADEGTVKEPAAA